MCNLSTPVISVILPVYNAEETLHKAIDSILQQTFTGFELIIINDGSDDTSDQIIASYTDSRIKNIKLQRSGVAKSLNIGLDISKGRYIARMDADDYSYPDRLKIQYEALEEDPSIGLIASKVKHVGRVTGQSQQGYFLYIEWINKLITHQEINLKRFVESPFAHPSVMFRKSLINAYGGYHEGMVAEDYELWLRLLDKGVKMKKVDKVLLNWLDLPSRLSRTSAHYSHEVFNDLKARYLCQALKRQYGNKFPDIWIWGNGKATRKKCKALLTYGASIRGYIDIKHHAPNTARKVMHYSEVGTLKNKAIILSYVGDRQGKSEILRFLLKEKFVEGKDFYMMA